MKIGKGLEAIVEELREQVQEATKPNDPSYLPQYCGSIRQSIQAVANMLDTDPTYAALAFHGMLKFVDRRAMERVATRLIDRLAITADMWPTIKQSVEVDPAAHPAAEFLQKAGYSRVLVIAFCANFLLKDGKAANVVAAEQGEVEGDEETPGKEEVNVS